ncbi:RsmB/NOP family class I SAM-dependent RNA methyltransferase [Hyphococcus flavus]|uniref:RsmB/NOP family class I SAM-dependent RNA methyltransferase n=1 Tax=Hyphococcus flavus TaxID=1866326 RepID=A0AAE9ZH41_9PROT|nr:RsmB/NOP family class I SAM-dependent RNA methyltransferase [Hyphococcus flavus]WDI30726.1 RsmB/NOP family class I SAM-dependent RNA methyltransferase [Hyphococcus flavus]
MRLSGRLSAAIEILDDFEKRRVPLKTAIADWSRNNRYAGAKDRAWISGLCLDVLRKRNSLAAAMGNGSARSLVLGALRILWVKPFDEIADAAAEEPHGPGALTQDEVCALGDESDMASSPCGADEVQAEERAIALGEPHVAGDFPEWLAPHIERVFGEDAPVIMSAFAERADIDMRLNTLKTSQEKTLAALKTVKAETVPILTTAARIAAPDPSEKAPGVTVIPAFNKGWVEVQDLGSQIAACAAGAIKGAQVLDYCAGGGGKTLALAAMMENTGQLYAYDRDPRRLKPLFHRAKRAGVRNLQIRSPAGGEGLDDLSGKMDVVFADAPCSGAGTWRRHPDTKWRLTEKQLQTRNSEQALVLGEASQFVKPGGRMVWVTCSFLMEENEDRLAAFLNDHDEFVQVPALECILSSGLITDDGADILKTCVTPDGAVRLTPDKIRADGFFIAVLEKRSLSG